MQITILSPIILLFFLSPLCTFSLSASAAQTDYSEINKPKLKHYDEWTFTLSPYLWFAGLSGHANVQNSRVNFSSPFSQLRKNLDFSLGARFEANKTPWALLLDPDYVKITQKPGVAGHNGKVLYQTTITDGGIYYTLFSRPKVKETDPSLSFEMLGAGRIITFHTVIDFLNNSSTASVADTSSVVVPLLGARFKYNFNVHTQAWISGDFGGFQVSHVSSTWSGTVGISYKLSDYFALSLAYKALDIIYSIQAVTYNTLLQGPVLGCSFSW